MTVTKDSSAPRRKATAPSGAARMLFLGLLACWALFPFMQIGALAEDAIPFIAAVRVHDQDATAIYSADENAQVPVPLRDAGCPLAPEGTDCRSYILPFLSPPQVFPIMKVVDLFGDGGSVLIMRLLAAGSFSGGMWLLWQKVTPKRPEAGIPLFLTAVLLTPFVYTASTFGQNSPLMFLSACLGLTQSNRTARAAGSAAAWVGTVVFKLFPLPLLLLAVMRRRWKFVGISVGLLVLLTLAAVPISPAGSYSEFLSSSRALTANRVASPWNVSIDSAIHLFIPTWRGAGAAFYAGVLVRVAIIGALFGTKMRDADEDFQWAYAWMALLALHPQIWWHYFMLIIPAVTLSLVGRRGNWWYLVPTAAFALLPLSIVAADDHLKALTAYGAIVIMVSVVGVPFLAKRRVRPALGTPESTPVDPAPVDA